MGKWRSGGNSGGGRGVARVNQTTQAMLARISTMTMSGPFGRRRVGCVGEVSPGLVFIVS